MPKIIIPNINTNNPGYLKGDMDTPYQHLSLLPDTNGGQGETMAELIPDHCSTWYIPLILNGVHNTPNKTDKRDIPINIHWEDQYPLNNTPMHLQLT